MPFDNIQDGGLRFTEQKHRRRLHGGDRPIAKKLWRRCPQVAPTEMCYAAIVYIAKTYSKHYECVIMKVKKGVLISA